MDLKLSDLVAFFPEVRGMLEETINGLARESAKQAVTRTLLIHLATRQEDEPPWSEDGLERLCEAYGISIEELVPSPEKILGERAQNALITGSVLRLLDMAEVELNKIVDAGAAPLIGPAGQPPESD